MEGILLLIVVVPGAVVFLLWGVGAVSPKPREDATPMTPEERQRGAEQGYGEGGHYGRRRK